MGRKRSAGGIGASPASEDRCGLSLVKVARRVSRIYDACLEPAGIRITQFLAMTALKELGRGTLAELSQRLEVEQRTMARIVLSLQTAGLVRTERSSADRRRRLMELTRRGHRVLDKATPLWRAAQEQLELQNSSD
ncbi:MAG: MarR family winged helix-turn-helix transcriptional regulator [Pseudomonadota bacterium]